MTHSAKLKPTDVSDMAVNSKSARKSSSAKDGAMISLPQAQLSVSSPRRAKTRLSLSKNGDNISILAAASHDVERTAPSSTFF